MPADSARADTFCPVCALMVEKISILPVLSHAKTATSPKRKKSPMHVTHSMTIANSLIRIIQTKPSTMAMRAEARRMGQVSVNSAVRVPISPAGLDMKAMAPPNEAVSTGMPILARVALCSSDMLAGSIGTHLYRSSWVGYVGYQQSVPLEPGRKQLSNMPSLESTSPFVLCTKNSGSDLPATLHAPPPHLYVPTGVERFFEKPQSLGQAARHRRTDGSRGSGM
mmetsp:Transcript_9377/g.21904  ORF Transcript_9377/g.21904 Transcript_9377/m.21904 type:complete len:224 (-) Transcript_9377:480-1151(-)